MKKNLLVTLATKEYLLLSKQLFSSVYFNAGWKGDYMLLACQIPEKDLRCFRQKNIIIKKCKPFYTGKKSKRTFNEQICTLKFLLFTPEFKKWKNIVYLDSDIIVKSSLDYLSKIKGFAAVPDSAGPLKYHFLKKDESNNYLFKKIINKYNLNSQSFNAGVMAFSTDIITKKTFSQLLALMKNYEKIRYTSDQMAFNLFFYKKWIRLPLVYNLLFFVLSPTVKKTQVQSIILHFAKSLKVIFKERNIFSREWCEKTREFDSIDFNKARHAKNIWTQEKIKKFQRIYKKIYAQFLRRYKNWRLYNNVY